MLNQCFIVLLPYEFLLEQNLALAIALRNRVLLPYEFLLEQNELMLYSTAPSVLLPYEFLLEQNLSNGT